MDIVITLSSGCKIRVNKYSKHKALMDVALSIEKIGFFIIDRPTKMILFSTHIESIEELSE